MTTRILKAQQGFLSDEIQKVYDESENEYNDINEIEKRLDVIYKLKSKYGGSVEEVFKRYDDAVKELFETENHDIKINVLKKEKEKAFKIMVEKAEVLTNKREKSASNWKESY